MVQDARSVGAKVLEGAIGRREEGQWSIFEGRLGRLVTDNHRIELQIDREDKYNFIRSTNQTDLDY